MTENKQLWGKRHDITRSECVAKIMDPESTATYLPVCINSVTEICSTQTSVLPYFSVTEGVVEWWMCCLWLRDFLNLVLFVLQRQRNWKVCEMSVPLKQSCFIHSVQWAVTFSFCTYSLHLISHSEACLISPLPFSVIFLCSSSGSLCCGFLPLSCCFTPNLCVKQLCFVFLERPSCKSSSKQF